MPSQAPVNQTGSRKGFYYYAEVARGPAQRNTGCSLTQFYCECLGPFEVLQLEKKKKNKHFTNQ